MKTTQKTNYAEENRNEQYMLIMQKHYDYIVKKWSMAQRKAMTTYNKHTNTNIDKIKRKIFYLLELQAGYDIYIKLKLEQYLGKKYTEKMFGVMLKRPDYNLFMFVFADTLDDNEKPRLYTLKEVKKCINAVTNSIEFIENTIYQQIIFSKAVKEKIEDISTLKPAIEAIIGKKHCSYDGWEVGSSGFSYYWYIEKSKYIKTVQRIFAWAKNINIEDYICIPITNHKEEPFAVYGNVTVQKEYYTLQQR